MATCVFSSSFCFELRVGEIIVKPLCGFSIIRSVSMPSIWLSYGAAVSRLCSRIIACCNSLTQLESTAVRRRKPGTLHPKPSGPQSSEAQTQNPKLRAPNPPSPPSPGAFSPEALEYLSILLSIYLSIYRLCIIYIHTCISLSLYIYIYMYVYFLTPVQALGLLQAAGRPQRAAERRRGLRIVVILRLLVLIVPLSLSLSLSLLVLLWLSLTIIVTLSILNMFIIIIMFIITIIIIIISTIMWYHHLHDHYYYYH